MSELRITDELPRNITRFYAERQDWSSRVAIYMGTDCDSSGTFGYVADVKFGMGNGAEGDVARPSILMQSEQGQRLINALWDAGLRPAQSNKQPHQAGELDAARKHLEDMRAIAFAKTGVAKP